MAWLLVFLILFLFVICTFCKAVKNVIVYILDLLGVDGRTIEFIISIIIIIAILFIFW